MNVYDEMMIDIQKRENIEIQVIFA